MNSAIHKTVCMGDICNDHPSNFNFTIIGNITTPFGNYSVAYTKPQCIHIRECYDLHSTNDNIMVVILFKY